MRALVPYVTGVLFGAGLLLGGMTRPAKVVGFLDLGGAWDPSLAFVMLGAIAVHLPAYRLVARMRGPVRGGAWALPTRKDIDARLVAGAALFGAGWGLGGYCPGPALTGVLAGAQSTVIFTATMMLGMWGWSVWEASAAPQPVRVLEDSGPSLTAK